MFQEDLEEKAVSQRKDGLFESWLPIVDEFRNILMSDEADIVGYQIKDFNIIYS